MIPQSDPTERLLADVLREDSSMRRFEDELRRRCDVELARRRRWRRLPRVFSVAAAAVFLVAAGIFWWLAPSPDDGPEARRPDYLVGTTALPGDLIVTTGAARHPDALVHTTSPTDVIVRSRIGSVACVRTPERPAGAASLVVRTQALPAAARLDDEGLLEVFSGVPVALVADRGARARLVFLDARDEARFMAH